MPTGSTGINIQGLNDELTGSCTSVSISFSSLVLWLCSRAVFNSFGASQSHRFALIETCPWRHRDKSILMSFKIIYKAFEVTIKFFFLFWDFYKSSL